jgi:putative ABC transport system ATP-binding protein
MTALVEVREAWRVYRLNGVEIPALRGVSLEVHPQDFLAIVGPSGSGKSTLLHLMGGVDLPTAGEVRLFGRITHRMTEGELARLRLHRIGFVFQRFFLLPHLTLEENLLLPMLEARVPAGERRRRVEELLGYVGLLHRRHHRPGQLSGGELQRGAVARALANRPALVLADEPTGELDEQTGREIGELFRRVHRDGVAVVVVTHNPELASLAQRVLTIRDGRLR